MLYLGIELGSTRIKSVLTDENSRSLAQGSHEWENRLEDGLWTYTLEDIWGGLQSSYAALNADYKAHFGKDITEVTAIGISAMMHGYFAFDDKDSLLVPFRTWRNTNTAKAAEKLTKLFQFNIPERWSVAHYYQAILNGEKHVDKVSFLTTLAGYVHYKLTGRKVIGIGDASGMFPIANGDYDGALLDKFNNLIHKDFKKLLPEILLAGQNAGTLTLDGAKLLDPNGNLKAGAPLCPPEGDAGTGMVATNSVSPKTANVSAGTSSFLMTVLERPLKNYYREIDMVTTPCGNPVAMVHVNNCTSEINAWADMFEEVISLAGGEIERGELFKRLFETTVESDADCGKITAYNFLSGEPIAKVQDGRPLLFRLPSGKLNLANFMQAQIYSALASLNLGLQILQCENVNIQSVCGHGGFFKTQHISQKAMSAAVNAPVTVMNHAGEGGAWGIALLAQYMTENKHTLSEFLNGVFKDTEMTTVTADEKEKTKFGEFMKSYSKGLQVEQLASEVK